MHNKSDKNLLLRKFVIESGKLVIEGLNRSQFERLAQTYPEMRSEQNRDGKVIIEAPVAGYGGSREADLNGRLGNWSLDNKNGHVFSSSSGFILPDGSLKSPDISWFSDANFAKVRAEYSGKGFLPAVPDFVIELRSKSDSLKELKTKMTDTWMANGVKLAWLIDPYDEKAYIYRPGEAVETVTGFGNKLSGEKLLPGFELDLSELRLVDGK